MKSAWAIYLPLITLAFPCQAVEILDSHYASTLAYDIREQNPYYTSDSTENLVVHVPSISNCFHQTKTRTTSVVTNSLSVNGQLTENEFSVVTDAAVHLGSYSTNATYVSSAYTYLLNVNISVTQMTYATLSLDLRQSHSGGEYEDLRRSVAIQGESVNFQVELNGDHSTRINTTIALTNGQYNFFYSVIAGTVHTTDTVVNLLLPLLYDSDKRFYRARYLDPF